jgi:hypothetical protein
MPNNTPVLRGTLYAKCWAKGVGTPEGDLLE